MRFCPYLYFNFLFCFCYSFGLISIRSLIARGDIGEVDWPPINCKYQFFLKKDSCLCFGGIHMNMIRFLNELMNWKRERIHISFLGLCCIISKLFPGLKWFCYCSSILLGFMNNFGLWFLILIMKFDLFSLQFYNRFRMLNVSGICFWKKKWFSMFLASQNISRNGFSLIKLTWL